MIPVRTDPLRVDLYQFTMLQAYFDACMHDSPVGPYPVEFAAELEAVAQAADRAEQRV